MYNDKRNTVFKSKDRDYNRPIIMQAEEIAKRVKAKRKIKDKDGLIVFSKKGDTR